MPHKTRPLNIAIVGCGPAGLACALALDQLGMHVALFERFAAPQPLGSGIILQPTGLRVLDELGVGGAARAAGQRIDTMLGYSEPAHRLVLNVNYAALGEQYYGVAIHRNALFEVLMTAVNSRGLAITTNTEIAEPQQLTDFDLIVDASGARSLLREGLRPATRVRPLKYGAVWGNFDWPGEPFGANRLEQRYVDAHTMIGVLPLGRGTRDSAPQVALFWSLPHASYDAWRGAGLAQWKEQVHAIWPDTQPILEQINSLQQLVLAQYAHHTLNPPYADGVVFIGDAAHATSPQLGQGANMALLDAWALAQALHDHADPTQALAAYASSRRWHVRSFQLASWLLTGFYQSDSRMLSRLRDFTFDPLSRLPLARRLVAGLISGLLGDPLGKIGLGDDVVTRQN